MALTIDHFIDLNSNVFTACVGEWRHDRSTVLRALRGDETHSSEVVEF